MTNNIDNFLGTEEPCASFHDARLVSAQINYEQRELVSDWELCVGNPNAPELAASERTRRGRLRLIGLAFWVMECLEPQGHILDGYMPWLARDGPLIEAGTDLSRELSARVPEGSSAWYLYFSGCNAFVYCADELGVFTWSE